MNKLCNKCDILKNITEFYKDKYRKDGKRNICKECDKLKSSLWSKINREKANAKSRNWFLANKERGKFLKGKANKVYRIKNIFKYYARVMARNLVREVCVVCGNNTAQSHHEDYNKPIDVVWLCRHHHQLRHNAMRRGCVL